MPRRPRHESRNRTLERRRDKRRNRKIQRIIKTYIRVKREYDEKITRHIKRLIRYAEEYSWWEMIIWGFTRPFMHRYRRILNIVDAIRILYEAVRGRAKILFKVDHVLFFPELWRMEITDDLLLSLPPEERSWLILRLLDVARGNPIFWHEIVENPTLRYYAEMLILYYRPLPCHHHAYVIKLTPVTLYYTRGVATRYYVMRWVKAKDVKADPFIGRSRPVDLHIVGYTYKPDWDIVNAYLYGGYGYAASEELITTSRDDKKMALTRQRLRRLIYQPHHVRRDFAKALGKPELSTVVGHCSVYGMLDRRRPVAKLYELNPDFRLLGRRSRRRWKDTLWVEYLRF